jgi:hypothetical protein
MNFSAVKIAIYLMRVLILDVLLKQELLSVGIGSIEHN